MYPATPLSRKCNDVDPDLSAGRIGFTKLGSPMEVQKHIRDWCATPTVCCGARSPQTAPRSPPRPSPPPRWLRSDARPQVSPCLRLLRCQWRCTVRPDAKLVLKSPEIPRNLRGGVITRLDIWSDFKPFFKASRSGVYSGPSSAVFQIAHSVLLVGYNNAERECV
jgi:hypothetical protein